MSYLNSVTIIGFVGADPEQRQARNNNGSKFTVLSVATQRSWKNAEDEWASKTEWHRVCVFRPRLAEYVATTIKKGSHVLVDGSLISTTYERGNGKGKQAKTNKQTFWCIRADVVADMHAVNIDTVGKVRSVLSAIFTYAIGKGDFPARSAAENPASRALLPESATEPEETIAATREEVKAILAHLATEGLTLQRAAVALIAYTGCRPGEARGLRWEEWSRTEAQIEVARSVWHTVEGTTKTVQSNRFVTVTDDLREILLDQWKAQASPISGYILARSDGGRVNLDNMARREIVPALSRCAVCKEGESAKHKGHAFKRDETLPQWHGWYSLRRFHGTQVRHEAGNSDTSAKALGNSKDVFDKHYLKSTKVLPDVRKAVNSAMRGLTN